MQKKKNPARKLQGKPKRRKHNAFAISNQINELLGQIAGERAAKRAGADVQFYSLPEMLDMCQGFAGTLLNVHNSNATPFDHERDLLFVREVIALCKEKYELPPSCAGILLVNVGMEMIAGTYQELKP